MEGNLVTPFAICFCLLILLAVAAAQQRRPARKFNPVNALDKWPDNDRKWRRTFRFERADIARLAHALRLPDKISATSRHTASGVDVLLYLLYRYGKGHELLDAEDFFQRDESTIGRLIAVLEDYLYQHGKDILSGFHPMLENPYRMLYYTNCVEQKGCPVQNVWAFIDGEPQSKLFVISQVPLVLRRWRCITCLNRLSLGDLSPWWRCNPAAAVLQWLHSWALCDIPGRLLS